MLYNVLDMHDRATLPRPACERLPNAQLPLVAVQTRFPALPRLAERVPDLREALRRDYPMFSDEKALNIVIRDGRATTEEGNRILRFSSIDLQWAAILAEDFVSLETRAYAGIADFSGRVDALWSTIHRILDPQYQTRIGLRFVNELRHPEGDDYSTWRHLLNPELLGFNASEILGGSVRQTVSELVLERPDGQLILRRGFLRGTTVIPLPGKIAPTSGFFLLDLDYSDTTAGQFDSAPSARLREYNEFLYRIFRWAVSDGEYYGFLQGKSK